MKGRIESIRVSGGPVTFTMNIIGGKWKPSIIYIISLKKIRFGIMFKTVVGISKYILTKHLRELESDGVLERKVYTEVPPKVEYYLTDKGETILPIIFTMESWGNSNMS